MNPINTRSPEQGERAKPWFRMRKCLAEWIEQIGSGACESTDPTAGFSVREWADLPTHHPAARQ